jgi:signal transduction histidine kinase
VPFIFERFFKVAEGGLGLRLTIVKELVEAHGGKVRKGGRWFKNNFLPASETGGEGGRS